jgi:heat shock protein HslJ
MIGTKENVMAGTVSQPVVGTMSPLKWRWQACSVHHSRWLGQQENGWNCVTTKDWDNVTIEMKMADTVYKYCNRWLGHHHWIRMAGTVSSQALVETVFSETRRQKSS